MTYIIKDPREALVEKGNALLDVLYRQHTWGLTYAHLDELMKKGKEVTSEEIAEAYAQHSFMEALLERLQLDSEWNRINSEYLMLRMTIEALEAPRDNISASGL